ncbi:NlpC/P60 family protein [Streptomyces sp. NPDC059740]|uniref:C40 family peptidase n=1 Tax=Streptomyces sp. NPDC059740 TaxID=3346926 RepID=UPI00365D4AA8
MVSHRRTAQPGPVVPAGVTARVTVLSAAAATAAAALAAPAVAEPEGHSARRESAARLDALYEKAESATDAYNGATERARRLRGEVSRLQDRLARSQDRLNRLRGRLGLVAAAQYRSGGMAPALRLVLADSPESYLESAATFDRLAGAQAGQLRAVRQTQRVLLQQHREAAAKLAELAMSRREVGRAKKDVERRLATARRLLKAMSPADRAAYDRASRTGDRSVHLPVPPADGPVAGVGGHAAAAVAAVRAAVGRPYVWGRNGPSAFDCSGLTQWAYGRAGVWLPRTSQAQRDAGRHVPLSQALPGDLVIYRDDASHVGMYVGGGQVVHAPYPGARVRYDPVGMMPIAAVTRP